VGTPRAASPLHDDEVCVPGGVFFLGDQSLAVAGNAQCSADCAAAPERLVRMSPFFIDRYEVTVSRWRAAVAAGFRPTPGTFLSATPGCTLRSSSDDADLPMNCVQAPTAQAFCAFDGGRLVTSEAQWEYAASGRGEERIYPWGDALPDCARAVYGRFPGPAAVPGTGYECLALGPLTIPLPVGSADGDVSRDGVRDLAGNLSEYMLDEETSYEDGCWSALAPRDPVCTHGRQKDNHTVKGGSRLSTPAQLNVALRDRFALFPNGYRTDLGFRCARPAVAP
jgi:formylglycine-generating enzyme required for sulfatase activity